MHQNETTDERGDRPAPAGALRSLIALAVPIVTVQLGLMLMGVADTVMIGRVSAVDLAAVALGHLYVFAIYIGGMGTLMALDPVIAQAVGAGDDEGVALGMQRGLVMGLALAIPASLALLPAGPVLTWLRQPAEVVPVASGYVWACIPGAYPFFAFVVLRQSLQAMGRLAPIVVTIVVANFLNVLLNWTLIFGRFGMPRLGAVGCGWATSLSRWFMIVMLVVVAWKHLRPALVPWRRNVFAARPFRRMLAVGLPIGIQYELEVGAFSVISLFMGWIGTRQIGGHQIALNLASLSFMVPLGLSSAASVLVGQAVGRGDPQAARRSAKVALAVGASFMAGCGVVFLAAPGALAGLYTDQVEVAALAATLIPIAGFFQVFDGLQVVSVGLLRGLGETKSPMVVNVIGFWLVGMPLSYGLGFSAGLGAVGLWWGLVAGLGAVAAFLMLRLAVRMNRAMPRLVIDEPAG